MSTASLLCPNYILAFAETRARDFYDIFLICSQHDINPESDENRKTITAIFQAKKVPLEYIKLIRENIEIHRSDWQSVIDTVSAKDEIMPFEFYLEYTLRKFETMTFP